MVTLALGNLTWSTCSTNRAIKDANDNWGTPQANLSDVRCTKPAPVVSELSENPATGSTFETLECFAESADVQDGDELVEGGTTYKVVGVAKWTLHRVEYLHVLLTEIKK